MEDKRTAFAILLIIILVMFYSEYVVAPSLRPPPRAVQAPEAAPSTGAPEAAATAIPVVPAPEAPPAAAILSAHAPSPEELAQSPLTTIETDKFILSFVHLGGRVRSLQLKEHRDHLEDPTPLDMVVSADDQPLPLGLYIGNSSDAQTTYQLAQVDPPMTAEAGRMVLSGSQEAAFTFTGTLPGGVAVEKTLRVRGNNYLFDVEAKVTSAPQRGGKVWLEWTRYLPEIAVEDRLDPWTFSILTADNSVKHLPASEIANTLSDPFAAKWAGIANKYFTSTLVAKVEGLNAVLGRTGSIFRHRIAGMETGGNFALYIGPKDDREMSAAGFQLDRSIDLGFFSFLAYPLLLLIRLFHSVLGNYGLAIVALTLLLKGLFFPLTRASLRSMKAMSELQPEMKALRERIKDPTQLNQEMMALYKRRGVNPLGGCLPILLQIPVFFGLYSALLSSIELRHAPFALWINDLSSPERLPFLGINFPVLIILMGLAMFYQQWTTPMPTADPAQRKMMLWMSAIFPVTFLIFPFPSGLALYMLTNTLISLVQQAYLRNDDKANPGLATTIASLAIFALAFVLTLI